MENNKEQGTKQRQTKKKKKQLTPKQKRLNAVLAVLIAIFVISGSVFVYFYWIKDAIDAGALNALLGGAQVNLNLDDASANSLDDNSDGLDSDTSPITYVGVDEIDLDSINFLTMNFSTLANANKNIKGWFYFSGPASIKGLPISVPLLQGTDNSFYLSHDFKDASNSNGSVYADYTANISNIKANRNTVIYGHARSYLKFGGLKYLDEATRWYANAKNHFVYITTEHEQSIWQVFSWYETTSDDGYRKSEFASDSDYLKFLNNIQSKNEIDSLKKFNFTKDDRIITLSTCKTLDKSKRVAVHAVLVKYNKY